MQRPYLSWAAFSLPPRSREAGDLHQEQIFLTNLIPASGDLPVSLETATSTLNTAHDSSPPTETAPGALATCWVQSWTSGSWSWGLQGEGKTPGEAGRGGLRGRPQHRGPRQAESRLGVCGTHLRVWGKQSSLQSQLKREGMQTRIATCQVHLLGLGIFRLGFPMKLSRHDCVKCFKGENLEAQREGKTKPFLLPPSFPLPAPPSHLPQHLPETIRFWSSANWELRNARSRQVESAVYPASRPLAHLPTQPQSWAKIPGPVSLANPPPPPRARQNREFWARRRYCEGPRSCWEIEPVLESAYTCRQNLAFLLGGCDLHRAAILE